MSSWSILFIRQTLPRYRGFCRLHGQKAARAAAIPTRMGPMQTPARPVPTAGLRGAGQVCAEGRLVGLRAPVHAVNTLRFYVQ